MAHREVTGVSDQVRLVLIGPDGKVKDIRSGGEPEKAKNPFEAYIRKVDRLIELVDQVLAEETSR